MRRPERAALLALAALLLLLRAGAAEEAASPAVKDPGRSLQDVERAIEQDKARAADLAKRSSTAASELDALRQKLIAAAAETQNGEEQVSAIRSTLAALASQEQETMRRLGAERGRLGLTVSALERLALYPPEALAALPESPVDTLRGALLIRAAIPAIEARAASLRAELQTLAEVRQQILRQRKAANVAMRQLEGDRAALAGLIERKAALYRDLEGERQGAEDRVVKLGAQAKDLRELMARIEAERAVRAERDAAFQQIIPPLPPRRAMAAAPPAAAEPPAGEIAAPAAGASPTIRPISAAEGRLTLPARGKITKEFGAPDPYGTTSKGISIATEAGAAIVAPYDGRVVYAGPFRGYGQILIIEHSEGYHSLLAGLARVDAAAGQWVLAGEPVGVMGQQDTGDPELYLELRRNGRPFNPLPWLALHKGKVSG